MCVEAELVAKTLLHYVLFPVRRSGPSLATSHDATRRITGSKLMTTQHAGWSICHDKLMDRSGGQRSNDDVT